MTQILTQEQLEKKRKQHREYMTKWRAARKMPKECKPRYRLNTAIFNEIRKQKGYTAERLAEEIHYSYDTVVQWAWKGRPLRKDSIEALEKCLGISRTEFLI